MAKNKKYPFKKTKKGRRGRKRSHSYRPPKKLSKMTFADSEMQFRSFLKEHGYDSYSLGKDLIKMLEHRVRVSGFPELVKKEIQFQYKGGDDIDRGAVRVLGGESHFSLLDEHTRVFLPSVYNDPNNYKPKYRAGVKRSHIMYYGPYKQQSYVRFALNKNRGRGAQYIEKSLRQFESKYPFVFTDIVDYVHGGASRAESLERWGRHNDPSFPM